MVDIIVSARFLTIEPFHVHEGLLNVLRVTKEDVEPTNVAV